MCKGRGLCSSKKDFRNNTAAPEIQKKKAAKRQQQEKQQPTWLLATRVLVSALPPEVLYRNNRLFTAFQKIDDDKSGIIDRDELRKLMSLFDSTLEEDELDMIMDMADKK